MGTIELRRSGLRSLLGLDGKPPGRMRCVGTGVIASAFASHLIFRRIIDILMVLWDRKGAVNLMMNPQANLSDNSARRH